MGGKVKEKCKSASVKLLSEGRRDIPDTVGELRPPEHAVSLFTRLMSILNEQAARSTQQCGVDGIVEHAARLFK